MNHADNDDIMLEMEDDGAEERTDAKLKKLRDELKKAKEEAAENLAGWQRSKADYVNLSRRMREQEEAGTKNNVAKMGRSIISVFDSLEAAEKSVEIEGGAALDGIRQVAKQLEQALREHGIERFTPASGDEFNPEMHEPVQTVATEKEKEDNTVSEVFQSGYAAHGTVIRPARVSVRKHG